MNRFRGFSLAFTLIISCFASAQIILPAIISDNMMLQQKQEGVLFIDLNAITADKYDPWDRKK